MLPILPQWIGSGHDARAVAKPAWHRYRKWPLTKVLMGNILAFSSHNFLQFVMHAFCLNGKCWAQIGVTLRNLCQEPTSRVCIYIIDPFTVGQTMMTASCAHSLATEMWQTSIACQTNQGALTTKDCKYYKAFLIRSTQFNCTAGCSESVVILSESWNSVFDNRTCKQPDIMVLVNIKIQRSRSYSSVCTGGQRYFHCPFQSAWTAL